VYPSHAKIVVEPYEIDRNWKRIVAYDYGLSDDSVFLIGAINPDKKKVVIYHETRVNNKNVEELAKIFHKITEDIPTGGLLVPPLIDPKSVSKRDYDKKTLGDHFLDFGISFKPGHVNVDARVFRLNTYIEAGLIEIFNTCRGLTEELGKYKFVEDESQDAGYTGKPVDKNNHGINCAEWITMELPADPSNLLFGIYDRMGNNIMETPAYSDKQKTQYWALSDYDDAPKTTGPFETTHFFNFF
jgi:hypothetical protein